MTGKMAECIHQTCHIVHLQLVRYMPGLYLSQLFACHSPVAVLRRPRRAEDGQRDQQQHQSLK